MYTHYNEPLFDYIIIRESDELVNGVAAKQVAEADSYSVQYIPNGLDNESCKQKDIELVIWVNSDSELY